MHFGAQTALPAYVSTGGGVGVMMMTNLVKWKAIHFISKRESSEPANVPTHEFQLFIFPLVFLPE